MRFTKDLINDLLSIFGTLVFPFIVYAIVSSLFSFFDAQNCSFQIAPLETRKSELESKLLKAKDKQNEFYTYMEKELKNEKNPEKLETLLQKKYMPILGLIKITKTGKESKKENFTVDIQELEEYFRQKKRATEEKKARRKKSIKEMTDEEVLEYLEKGEEED